jgi:hypothetical protein
VKTKLPPLPQELANYIKAGYTVFHCKDGEWELLIESQKDSPIGGELPPRSTVIAENGSGDFLFVRTQASGKFDSKVYVYWHEEERHEVFAKSLADLMVAAKTPAAAKKKPATSKGGPTVAQLDAALKLPKASARSETMRKFAQSDFGVDALPALRNALRDDDVDVAITAADCIAKLGPAVASDSDSFDDLEIADVLMEVGGKIWSYSGYANCYSSCLDALVKCRVDEEDVVAFVHHHIGLENEDDLLASLQALASIGTPESIDLLKRAATFWLPELNMAKAKKVKAIVDGAKRPKKK